MVTASGQVWVCRTSRARGSIPADHSHDRTATSTGRTLRPDMTDWALWLIAAGVFGGAEMLTPTFSLGMLAAARAAAPVAAGGGFPPAVQLGAFAASSLLLIGVV